MGIISQLDSRKREIFPVAGINDEPEECSLVQFAESTKKICVGIVDVVGSTKITAKLTNFNVANYYGTFLNTLGSIILRFQGNIVKNIGDSILYYFPEETVQSQFVRCLECNLSMLNAHNYLNAKLRAKGLPRLDYRISSDYGSVAIAKTPLMAEDIFGQPVNVCSKINALASPNSLVIGSDFYEIVKNLECYRFEGAKSYSSGLKTSYPVFSVSHNNSKIRKMTEKCVEKTLLQIGHADCELIVRRLFEKHGRFLSDYYDGPEYLRDVLADVYGNGGHAIQRKIEKQIEEQQIPRPAQGLGV